MINLFEFDNHIIDTSTFDHLLHGEVVKQFEQEICEYVGAKYAASFFSASYALYAIMKSEVCRTPWIKKVIDIPSMIPPVVPNVIVDAGYGISFNDDIDWVGGSYTMTDGLVDSAQKLNRNQYAEECDPDDLLVFSMYPTKPLSSLDGGVVVSNNKKKIDDLKSLSFYGMEYAEESWSRVQKQVGFKAYMSTMQATIASRNLKTLDSKYERIDEIRNKYNSEFGLENTSRHLYRIKVQDNIDAMSYFKDKGIITGIHYKPQHDNLVFSNFNDGAKNLEKVKLASKQTVSIPLHHNLTDEHIEYIITEVKDLYNWRNM